MDRIQCSECLGTAGAHKIHCSFWDDFFAKKGNPADSRGRAATVAAEGGQVTQLEQIRAAILKHFGEVISSDPERAREIVEQDTYTGQDDPGGWSPEAVAIIHCESGIPSGLYNAQLFEKWFSVSNELDGLFCEHINAAVIGVYEV